MGIIQSAMNQMLSTAGIAARLAPGYETKQKEYEKKKSLKVLDKQAGTEMGAGESYLEDRTDLLEDIARIRPNEKNINTFMQSLDDLNQEQKRIYANKKAAQEQETKRKQKEEHEKFVQMFTQGGEFK